MASGRLPGRSIEHALRDVRDAAGEVGLAGRHDIVVAAIGDAGREDHVAHVHLVLDRVGEVGIDAKLSFPLEDLYVGGDKAGQVGQEIYGAGAAFVFASRVYHHVEGAPFDMFCNAFLLASDRTSDQSLSFHLGGDPAGVANLSLIGKGPKSLSGVKVTSEPRGDIASRRYGSRRQFDVPANARVHIRWR